MPISDILKRQQAGVFFDIEFNAMAFLLS